MVYHPEAVGRPHDARWVAYATDGLWRVPGWASSLTLYLFSEVDRVQRELGIIGHLGEIGVFRGRTLIALAMLARPGETAAGFDNFHFLPGATAPERLRRELAAVLGPGAPIRVIRADSTTLGSSDLIGASGGPYRLFQVDGGHDAVTVAHDLQIAADALAPGGVLVADDVFQEMFPGVNDAARAFIESQPADGFVPFLLGGGRTFLARREFAGQYREAMVVGEHGYRTRTETFVGHAVRCVGYESGPLGPRRRSDAPRPRWLRAYRLVRRQVRKAQKRLGGRAG